MPYMSSQKLFILYGSFYSDQNLPIFPTLEALVTTILLSALKIRNNKCWQGCGGKESLGTIGQTAKYSHYGQQYGSSLKN